MKGMKVVDPEVLGVFCSRKGGGGGWGQAAVPAVVADCIGGERGRSGGTAEGGEDGKVLW